MTQNDNTEYNTGLYNDTTASHNGFSFSELANLVRT
jgi:hypothetical protein